VSTPRIGRCWAGRRRRRKFRESRAIWPTTRRRTASSRRRTRGRRRRRPGAVSARRCSARRSSATCDELWFFVGADFQSAQPVQDGQVENLPPRQEQTPEGNETMTHTTISRRDVLRSAGAGFGYLALAGLLGQESARAAKEAPRPLAAKRPHVTAK